MNREIVLTTVGANVEGLVGGPHDGIGTYSRPLF